MTKGQLVNKKDAGSGEIVAVRTRPRLVVPELVVVPVFDHDGSASRHLFSDRVEFAADLTDELEDEGVFGRTEGTAIELFLEEVLIAFAHLLPILPRDQAGDQGPISTIACDQEPEGLVFFPCELASPTTFLIHPAFIVRLCLFLIHVPFKGRPRTFVFAFTFVFVIVFVFRLDGDSCLVLS